MFQSTRPRGARRPPNVRCLRYRMFQSTRPRGARREGISNTILLICFNPRAREGRDRKSFAANTGCSRFQSTRPRGARQRQYRAPDVGWMFQSTRPRGARRDAFPRAHLRSEVSIHAPARGATATEFLDNSPTSFQSTRPRGARPQAHLVTAHNPMFQSTRPRGARP